MVNSPLLTCHLSRCCIATDGSNIDCQFFKHCDKLNTLDDTKDEAVWEENESEITGEIEESQGEEFDKDSDESEQLKTVKQLF